MDALAPLGQLDISEDEAKSLLKRALAVISKMTGIKAKLIEYDNGDVCILTPSRQIVAIRSSYGDLMFFPDAIAMLSALMENSTVIYLYIPKSLSEVVKISFTEMFGSTLEELKIKLDLMK